MNQEINLEEFDQFISGEMDESDQDSFQNKLESSNRVREAFFLHKVIIDVVKKTPQRTAIRNLNQRTRDLIQEEQNRRFEDYFNNKLTRKEKEEFDEKLEADGLFAFEFRQFQANRTPLIIRRMPVYFKRILQVAATLLICTIISYSLLQLAPEKKSEQLYASYFELPKAIDAIGKSKSISERVYQLMEEGEDAFDNRQHLTAIQKLEQSLELSKTNNEDKNFLYLYIGLSYKELGEYPKCIRALRYGSTNLNEPSNILLKEFVQWHLALAYLKVGDIEHTRMTLNQLIASGEDEELKTKAINLLNDLS